MACMCFVFIRFKFVDLFEDLFEDLFVAFPVIRVDFVVVQKFSCVRTVVAFLWYVSRSISCLVRSYGPERSRRRVLGIYMKEGRKQIKIILSMLLIMKLSSFEADQNKATVCAHVRTRSFL